MNNKNDYAVNKVSSYPGRFTAFIKKFLLFLFPMNKLHFVCCVFESLSRSVLSWVATKIWGLSHYAYLR